MSSGFTEPLVHSTKSNQAPYAYRAGLGMMPANEWIVFFDDFVQAVGAETSTTNVPTGWTADIIDAGCTVTNTALHGGVLLFDSDADNQGASIYLPQSVKLDGKKFFMEVRVKMEDVSAMTFQFGLTDLTATTNPEDLWTTASADFIAFGNLDAATLTLTYDKNNGGPVAQAATETLEDDTYAVLAISYNGASTPADNSLQAWLNGESILGATTEAQVPEDLALAPFVGMLAGHATTADTLHLDYVRFAVER